jgi:CHAT domain-containing protein/tetratricopeptide (TPR) repeat protein
MARCKRLSSAFVVAFPLAVAFWLGISFPTTVPCLTGGAAGSEPDTLAVQILRLRGEGRYAEALEAARLLLRETEDRYAAESWEIRDAEILVATIESLTQLSENARKEMSEADRSTQAIQDLTVKLRLADGIRAAEGQLETRKRYLGDAHPEVAETLHNLGILYRESGKYSESIEVIRQALAIEEGALGQEHPLFAESLCELAAAYLDKGDFPQAEPPCRQALALIERMSATGRPGVARAWFILGRVSEEGKGDYDQARTCFEKALAIQEKSRTPVPRDLIATLARLAPVYARLGRVAEAEAAGGRAIEVSKETFGPEHPDFAGAVKGLGMVEWHKGDYSEAERLFRQALAIEESALGREHPLVGRTLNNLASVCLEQGKYDEAEVLYVRSRALLEAALGADNAIVAQPLHNLGVLYREQGRYVEAEEVLGQVLVIRRHTLGRRHPHVASCLLNLGALRGRSGNYAGADTLLRQALAIYEESRGPRSHEVAVTLANLADVLFKGDLDPAEAKDMLSRALDIQNELFGPEQPNSAHILGQMGDISRARGEIAEAEQYYRQAIMTAEKTLAAQHPVFCPFLDGLASCYLRQDDVASAETALSEAASVYETARLRAGGGFARATFRTSPYARLAAVRLEMGDPAGAWTAAELGLGRALADLLMASDHRSLSAPETAMEDSLNETLYRLEGEMGALRSEARTDSSEGILASLTETRRRLLETEVAWAAFQHEMAGKYPVTEGKAFELGRVQAALAEDMALVGWIAADLDDREAMAWGYVVRRSGPVVWARIGLPGADGEKYSGRGPIREFLGSLTLAAAWRERVFEADFPAPQAERLWSVWFAPLEPYLDGIGNLIVVTSGPLLGVPIEALVDSTGAYLGERLAISYSPSGTVLAWLSEKARRREKAGTARALLLGDPPFAPEHLLAMETEQASSQAAPTILREPAEGAHLRSAMAGTDKTLATLLRLPWSRREVEEVARVIPVSRVLVGAQASEQELARLAQAGELEDFNILHFATHALVDDEMPECSALALSRIDLPDPLESIRRGGRLFDGLVSAKEIVREWKLDADLVTLSGCRTGLGKEIPGEGYIGLAHAFLQTGARSLVVSLWRVEDEATAMLMARFYENLTGNFDGEREGSRSEPMPKALALKEAKHWLRTYTDETGRQPFSHPVYWSGFILIGTPE